MSIVQIHGYAGEPIHSFSDWQKYALPPDSKKQHWVQGRSAYELGFCWAASDEPTVPSELIQLLDSQEETRRIVILSGITERETRLPFREAARVAMTSHCGPERMQDGDSPNQQMPTFQIRQGRTDAHM